jgi:hypothetical protein
MKFDTSIKQEKSEAFKYFMGLVNRKKLIEVKKISPTRTLNQNSYLHLLLSAYGAHFGYTLAEAKTLYKRDINPDLYVYSKHDSKFLKSSADLTVEEMTISIERLRQEAADSGFPLPSAEEPAALRSLEKSIEQNSHYMKGGL